ncbi:carbohydrate-binding protein [Pontiellaceae bacterium B1224]|nr:carbohydrate-binding protein [Pontiellaceae bacterium B1224]
MPNLIKSLLVGLLIVQRVVGNPVTVDSLDELMPYLSQDNVNLVMKPGVYTITAEDAKAGKFGSDTFQDWCKTLLPFSGSDSTYDFTDVTLKVETGVFQSLGKFDIFELQTTGNNIVIKNLKIEDVGSVYDAPTKGALGIVMDGSHNRLDGVHLSTKGSYPYGYGEAFGKGGQNVVRHMKHCGILVRGLSNHVKDCTIIHRCFGHALFMQGADQPVIEGCYIEGEMRATDDMLAEKGTGSIADKVNFMTYFGYPIPPGYAMCTGEEGIRAYDGGQTWIDGEIINRRAMNPTILNCTVKNMRGGVTLTHAGGKKYVKGTTAIGCTRGFAIGSGDIVDCYADTQYGPALGVDYDRDSGMNAEITLLPNEGPAINGPGYAAFITGKNHNITLKTKVPNPDQNLMIRIGGNKQNIGSIGKVSNYSASDIVINNYTAHPILLGDRVENVSGITGGLVTDLGKNNSIKHEPVKQLEIVNENPIALTAGEAVEFEIEVPIPGTYFLDYQITASSNGSFSVTADGEKLEEVSFTVQSLDAPVRSEKPVALKVGKQMLGISANLSGMKIQGIDFILELPATPVVPFSEVVTSMGESLGKTQDTHLTVFPGQTVLLEPEPDFGGTWVWTGPNGFVSNDRKLTLSNVQENRSGTYTASFTNVGGYETVQPFEIAVVDLLTIEVEEGATEFDIELPYPGMYVFGAQVSAESAGVFAVAVNGVEVDRVDFEASSRDWKTVSSGTPIYLKRGAKKLQLTSASYDWKLDWIKLKAVDFVSPAVLPLVYNTGGDSRTFSGGVLDISGEESVDVFVVYQNRGSMKVFAQLDGGTPRALNTARLSSCQMLATGTGISGTTLKLLIDGGRNGLDRVDGIYILKSRDPFARIEAENYDEANGTRQEETRDEGGGSNVGSIRDGDWLKFENLNLTEARYFSARVANIASGGSFGVRLGSPDGPKIATVRVPKTGGWQNWETVQASLDETGGIHDVYLVFRAESMAGNLNWIEFSPE